MKHLKHVAFTTAGAVLVLIGLALLVLPGPGLLVVLAGLVTLAAVFPRLDRHVQAVRRQALKAAEDSVSSGWRLAGSVVLGVLMIGVGVALALVPGLPFSGWQAGVSIIVSGLVVLGLLAYSHRRVRGRRHS
ncbi:PGPGW domain-containing protein [Catenulispora subtropica]|uniref:Transmembrane protein (PGPGW) n=1 Tax=Catenulispora subtropica TaxID=450798 RepID=A0ABP5EKS2_9ACTN